MKSPDVVQLSWKYLPALRPALNRAAINRYATRTLPRPRAFSLWSPEPAPAAPDQAGPITDYTSWPALTDRSFSGRHLPPASPEEISALPRDEAPDRGARTYGDVSALFLRKEHMKPSRSSALFMFFAQWFTDSVLRTHPTDRRKNTSNHDIDLCQIYGLNEGHARMLRIMVGGRLKSQLVNGEELPCYLHEPGTRHVKAEFKGLVPDELLAAITRDMNPSRIEKLYATGLERGNSSVGYVAISTLFLREHNRICDELARQPGSRDWDDERLFQTARCINTVLLMRLLLSEYINHINSYPLFQLDTSFAEKKNWYRANWIALEFDLLYRWHGLVPEKITIDGKDVAADDFRHNNGLLEQVGLAKAITGASCTVAGKIGLGNTPRFLMEAEYKAIKMGRDFRLRSFNDYREEFGLARLSSFAELTPDEALQNRLQALYGDIDKLELVVGLFAEESRSDVLFGSLMTNMVAYDAFTHIFSNPLLSCRVYNERTFTRRGMELIEETRTLEQLVRRNVQGPFTASFDAPSDDNVVRLGGTGPDKPERQAAE